MASLEERKWTRRFLFAGALLMVVVGVPLVYAAAVDAPAGFDNLTNGFETQSQMDLDRAVFEEREGIADGLGPIYNAQSCTECHQNPVSCGWDGSTATPSPTGRAAR
jgi:hypothetical protein